MYLEWVCFKFPTLNAATAYTLELSESYRASGMTGWAKSWERPKRRKGGYAVAILTADKHKAEVVAGFHAGEWMAPKPGKALIEIARRNAAANAVAPAVAN